jgi:hypothetical protein
MHLVRIIPGRFVTSQKFFDMEVAPPESTFVDLKCVHTINDVFGVDKDLIMPLWESTFRTNPERQASL